MKNKVETVDDGSAIFLIFTFLVSGMPAGQLSDVSASVFPVRNVVVALTGVLWK